MAMIQLIPDFKEFLQLLNDHEVEYLVVGGYAVSFHGYIRTTGDIDFWVAVHPENAKKLTAVLLAFGFSAKNIHEDLFLDEKKIFQFGVPPFRIDILLRVSGLEFAPSYAERVVEKIDGVMVNLINFEDLKTNKLASGRPKDISDLDYFSK